MGMSGDMCGQGMSGDMWWVHISPESTKTPLYKTRLLCTETRLLCTENRLLCNRCSLPASSPGGSSGGALSCSATRAPASSGENALSRSTIPLIRSGRRNALLNEWVSRLQVSFG